MADNYLEKKYEEFKSGQKKAVLKAGISLDTLFTRNRSYRGYNKDYVVKMAQLERIAGVCTKIASARNQQVLRFKLLTKENGGRDVLPLIKLGGSLPELHLPFPGTEPEAFIIVCSTVPEGKYVDFDLGIACQSMLLKATEMGLGGIIICAFDKETVRKQFDLPLDPLAIIAIGKPAEEIRLKPIKAEENHAYYRENGVHIVPKVKLEDLFI